MSECVQVNGIFPQNAIYVNAQPGRSECGIAAMIPWAGKLWYATYASGGKENGTGLYSLDANMKQERYHGSVPGTFFNRHIHSATGEANIGPYLIDDKGNVRVIPGLAGYAVASSFRHLSDAQNKFMALTIDGLLFEVDVRTLSAALQFDLKKELSFDDAQQCRMSAGVAAQGRIFVACSSYDERDREGLRQAGRLAEYDGQSWKIVEKKPFAELVARGNWGEVVFATGWDKKSAILNVFAEGKWTRYRLPKGSMNFELSDAAKNVRIKEVETEGYLMDHFGLFYDLCPVAWEGKVFGIRPICSHLKKIQDFCSYRGMLVLAGDQSCTAGQHAQKSGDAHTNLIFAKVDDLWQYGKPMGMGNLWLDEQVADMEASDPYLATGFDKKMIYIRNDADSGACVALQVDFTGLQEWATYQTIEVGAHACAAVPLPSGFACHWLRFVARKGGQLTATVIYG